MRISPSHLDVFQKDCSTWFKYCPCLVSSFHWTGLCLWSDKENRIGTIWYPDLMWDERWFILFIIFSFIIGTVGFCQWVDIIQSTHSLKINVGVITLWLLFTLLEPELNPLNSLFTNNNMGICQYTNWQHSSHIISKEKGRNCHRSFMLIQLLWEVILMTNSRIRKPRLLMLLDCFTNELLNKEPTIWLLPCTLKWMCFDC